MAFSRMFPGPFRPAFDAGLAAAAVPAWWLAGGAPTPIAVYQPKGAASLAASYVNLANPGTYDAAPGTAPTLDASGWVFNGSKYLVAGITIGSSSWSALARYTTTADGVIFGNTSPDKLFNIQRYLNIIYFGNGTFTANVTDNSGTVAMAGLIGYRDGVSVGAIGTAWSGGSSLASIGIGSYQNGNIKMTGTLQALAIWDTSTNHATWMPACMAAVALI